LQWARRLMSGPRFREGQQIELGTLALRVRRLQQWLVAVTAVTAFAAFSGAVANVKACQSRHTIVQAGERILPTREMLAVMLHAGQITREQYEQGLRNLAAWRTADCDLP
jgi:hypothetical protein